MPYPQTALKTLNISNEGVGLLEFFHRLVSQKTNEIYELKILRQNITIHTYTKFTQGSITNHRAPYMGA
jgi:hypothetical protein